MRLSKHYHFCNRLYAISIHHSKPQNKGEFIFGAPKYDETNPFRCKVLGIIPIRKIVLYGRFANRPNESFLKPVIGVGVLGPAGSFLQPADAILGVIIELRHIRLDIQKRRAVQNIDILDMYGCIDNFNQSDN